MCRKLKVSTSGFYAWCKRGASHRAAEDVRLAVHVRAIHAASRKTYGSPRVQRELARQGLRTSRKRVMLLMRSDGLLGLRKRRFKKTTESNQSQHVAQNLLDRKFVSGAPNRVWVGDITYVRTHEGWFIPNDLDRPLLATRGRLGRRRYHGDGVAIESTGDGSGKPQHFAWVASPYGSRQPIQQRRVSSRTYQVRHGL